MKSKARRRLGGSAGITIVVRAAGMVSLFAMHLLVSRRLGAEEYGEFSYIIRLTGLLAMMVPLGWPSALLRFVVQYLEQADWSRLKGILIASVLWVILASTLGSVLLYLVGIFVEPSLSVVVTASSLLLPVFCLAILRNKALLALNRVVLSFSLDEVGLPIGVATIIIVTGVESGTLAAGVYTGVGIAGLVVGWILVWRSIPAPVRTAKVEYEIREWFSLALPLVAASLSQIVLNRTDVLMLGAMRGFEEVGWYVVANRLALMNTFVLTAVGAVAAPTLGAAFVSGRIAEFRNTYRWATMWALVGAMPFLAVEILAAESMMGLFGSDYDAHGSLLRILAIGQFLNAATGPVGFGLIMSGRERIFAVFVGLGAVMNIFLNLFLITLFHAVGAAVATTVTVSIVNVGMLLALRRTGVDGCLQEGSTERGSQ